MMLWLIISLSTLVALAVVLWPVWQGTADAPADPGSAIYRDQLGEIEGDLKRGLLSDSEAAASRAEVARRLLAAEQAHAAPPTSTAITSGRPIMAAALLALFGVAALGLYRQIGAPSLPDLPLAGRLAAPTEGDSIDVLIAKVEERLRLAPEDGEGWDVIAPVYLRVGRAQEAADAYAQAIRLLGEDAKRLEGFGVATVAAADGLVSEASRQAFERAIALDAKRIESRFWLAAAAEQDGRKEEAAAGYRDVLARSPGDASWRPMVEQRLAGVMGVPQSPGPSAADVDAAASMTAEERQTMIEGMVAGLAEKLKTDTNNIDGWLRLIRAYTVLEKRELALKALAEARGALSKDSAALASLDGLAKELGLES
ncbi:MAG: c-type cytochrome biogenesis protein CcmI [Hyphomicrobiaceae bacterium]